VKRFLSVFFVIGFILLARGNSTLITTKSGCSGQAQAKSDDSLSFKTGAEAREFYQQREEERAHELEVQQLRDQVMHYEDLVVVEPYAENELLREQIHQLKTDKQTRRDDMGTLLKTKPYTSLGFAWSEVKGLRDELKQSQVQNARLKKVEEKYTLLRKVIYGY